MLVSDFLSVLLRWIHVVSAILWVGLLYFFNFTYVQFASTLQGESRKTVFNGLAPKTLYWFRWGAAYTWVSGFLLLFLVYYHGGLMFESDNLDGWGTGAIVMVAATFLLFGVYDQVAKSSLGKNPVLFGVISYVAIVGVIYLMVTWGAFSYRAYNIHLGAMFGTIMAANVWMRIYPGQRKVLAAVKEGTMPDPALMAMVGSRSRHNTYLSIPLVWAMINAHTAVPAADTWLYLPGVVLLGWVVVALLYRKAAVVTGP